MLTPPSNSPQPKRSSLTTLAARQAEIDALPTYEAQIETAKAYWANRTNNAAFTDIKTCLKERASAKKYCCYCEHNEFSDIEHFYPKTLFPNKAFVWENYLYVCGLCNSKYKNDAFSIFVGNNVVNISPTTPRVYAVPANTDSVLINPNAEDPMDFLWLNLRKGVYLVNFFNDDNQTKIRAEYTLEVLNLARFKRERKEKATFFLSELRKYHAINQADSLESLVEITEQYLIDRTATFQNLEAAKQTILNNIQQTILRSTHQTVWAEMKRQRQQIPLLSEIFDQIPEALEWSLS